MVEVGEPGATGSGRAAPVVSRRAWRALAVGCVGFSLISFNMTATNLSFGPIAEDFPGASLSTVSWVASIFFIGLASLLLVSGRLADRAGRRLMFRAGLAVFALGAVCSAVAPTVWILIAARLIASVGGALVIPSSLAVVLPEFPRERHVTAISVWSATGPIASAVAPPVSAVVLGVSGWRLLFLLSTPIALGSLGAGWGVLRESRAQHRAGPLDATGVAIGTMAIASLVFAVSQGANLGWTSPAVVAGYIGFAFGTPLFLRRCRRHPEPLLDLDVFLLRPVWTANLGNFFINIAALGGWLAWPLFLSRVWDFSPLATGLALTPAPVVSGMVAVYGSTLFDRFGPARVASVGSIVSLGGYLWAAVMLRHSASYWWTAFPSIACMGAGWALTQPPLNSALMAQVGADLYGQANAAFNTVRNIAGAMGIAISVAVIGDPGGGDVLDAYRGVFVAFAASAALCLLTLVLLFPRTEPDVAAEPGSGAPGSSRQRRR